MEYYVYKIIIDRITRYIGRTNNIDRRTKEHNYRYKTGLDKPLYNFLRSTQFDKDIKLQIVYKSKNKTDAKRKEMFLILKDYFSKKQLIQKVPRISDM